MATRRDPAVPAGTRTGRRRRPRWRSAGTKAWVLPKRCTLSAVTPGSPPGCGESGRSSSRRPHGWAMIACATGRRAVTSTVAVHATSRNHNLPPRPQYPLGAIATTSPVPVPRRSSSSTTSPPIELPTRWAPSRSSSVSSRVRWSANASTVTGPSRGAAAPKPGRSMSTTSRCGRSSGSTSRQQSDVAPSPCTSTIAGPAPERLTRCESWRGIPEWWPVDARGTTCPTGPPPPGPRALSCPGATVAPTTRGSQVRSRRATGTA